MSSNAATAKQRNDDTSSGDDADDVVRNHHRQYVTSSGVPFLLQVPPTFANKQRINVSSSQLSQNNNNNNNHNSNGTTTAFVSAGRRQNVNSSLSTTSSLQSNTSRNHHSSSKSGNNNSNRNTSPSSLVPSCAGPREKFVPVEHTFKVMTPREATAFFHLSKQPPPQQMQLGATAQQQFTIKGAPPALALPAHGAHQLDLAAVTARNITPRLDFVSRAAQVPPPSARLAFAHSSTSNNGAAQEDQQPTPFSAFTKQLPVPRHYLDDQDAGEKIAIAQHQAQHLKQIHRSSHHHHHQNGSSSVTSSSSLSPIRCFSSTRSVQQQQQNDSTSSRDAEKIVATTPPSENNYIESDGALSDPAIVRRELREFDRFTLPPVVAAQERQRIAAGKQQQYVIEGITASALANNNNGGGDGDEGNSGGAGAGALPRGVDGTIVTQQQLRDLHSLLADARNDGGLSSDSLSGEKSMDFSLNSYIHDVLNSNSAAFDHQQRSNDPRYAQQLLAMQRAMSGGDLSAGHHGSTKSSAAVSGTTQTTGEAATMRVARTLFLAGLCVNTEIYEKLKRIPLSELEKRLNADFVHRRQVSKEDFVGFLVRALQEEHINRREVDLLFSMLDANKYGIVDTRELRRELLHFVKTGTRDISFQFVASLLEGRDTHAINAFISRFDIQNIVRAIVTFYSSDKEVCDAVSALPDAFRYKDHLARVPVAQFRDRIVSDPLLLTIFQAIALQARRDRSGGNSPVTASASAAAIPTIHHANSTSNQQQQQSVARETSGVGIFSTLHQQQQSDTHNNNNSAKQQHHGGRNNSNSSNNSNKQQHSTSATAGGAALKRSLSLTSTTSNTIGATTTTNLGGGVVKLTTAMEMMMQQATNAGDCRYDNAVMAIRSTGKNSGANDELVILTPAVHFG